jgi:hypothetical protein
MPGVNATASTLVFAELQKEVSKLQSIGVKQSCQPNNQMSVRILVGELSVQGLFGHVFRPHMLGFWRYVKQHDAQKSLSNIQLELCTLISASQVSLVTGQSITALLDDV